MSNWSATPENLKISQKNDMVTEVIQKLELSANLGDLDPRGLHMAAFSSVEFLAGFCPNENEHAAFTVHDLARCFVQGYALGSVRNGGPSL